MWTFIKTVAIGFALIAAFVAVCFGIGIIFVVLGGDPSNSGTAVVAFWFLLLASWIVGLAWNEW